MKLWARGGASEISIGAVVTRADGRIEDLGTISYWHKSLWRRILFRLRKATMGA